MPGQPWDLSHFIPAERGGRTTLQNTSPQHRRCNRSDGGKRGAQIRHAKRPRKGLESDGLGEWY